MSQARFPRRWAEAPIAVQIVAMLIAGVVVGQVLILLIVTLLPPPRPPVYHLSEIAAALDGLPQHPQDGAPLVRRLGPPPAVSTDPRAAPFLQADRAELARLLGVGETAVLLNVERPSRRYWGGPPFVGPPRPPGQRHGSPMPGQVAPHDLIFGRFQAALRQPSGQWMVVSPEPDPFPNSWQLLVIMWFLACLVVLGPAGYLFARGLVRPITAFARAAERLGRDPVGAPVLLRGPSEIGVAARAFNEMQARLKRYVEDRLAMIGAISHDLRTPLARIRFKIEGAPPALRDAVASDLDQMEAMIAAAVAFVHDATHVPDREQLDLLSVLECVVDDARSAGGEAHLSASAPLVVEGDALALNRLFANLVDNALKYGGQAEVSLFAEAGDAVIEVADQGPGLPPEDMERVFEPFYRGEASRNRETGGIGLGLAVVRSIARGHGGDVALRAGVQGLIASVRLPALTPGAKAL